MLTINSPAGFPVEVPPQIGNWGAIFNFKPNGLPILAVIALKRYITVSNSTGYLRYKINVAGEVATTLKGFDPPKYATEDTITLLKRDFLAHENSMLEKNKADLATWDKIGKDILNILDGDAECNRPPYDKLIKDLVVNMTTAFNRQVAEKVARFKAKDVAKLALANNEAANPFGAIPTGDSPPTTEPHWGQNRGLYKAQPPRGRASGGFRNRSWAPPPPYPHAASWRGGGGAPAPQGNPFNRARSEGTPSDVSGAPVNKRRVVVPPSVWGGVRNEGPRDEDFDSLSGLERDP